MIFRDAPQKLSVWFIILNFLGAILIPTPIVHASTAIILTDQELDQIYAEGLFFDFDAAFGEVNDIISKDIDHAQPLTRDGTVYAKNPNIKYIQQRNTKEAIIPSLPEKPSHPSTPASVAKPELPGKSVAQALPRNSNQGGTVTKIPLSTNQVGRSDNIVVDLPVLPNTTDQMNPTDLAGVVDAVNQLASLATTADASPSEPNNAINPVQNSPSIPNVPGPINPANPPSGPEQPATPQFPAVQVADPIEFDLVAGQGADGQFEIGLNTPQIPTAPSSSDAPETPDTPTSPGIPSIPNVYTGNTGNNYVNVDGLSQQHLSALVNVNAAGSIVPVTLNITINMNSTIENLTNTNTVNIAAFDNLSFQ